MQAQKWNGRTFKTFSINFDSIGSREGKLERILMRFFLFDDKFVIVLI